MPSVSANQNSASADNTNCGGLMTQIKSEKKKHHLTLSRPGGGGGGWGSARADFERL